MGETTEVTGDGTGAITRDQVVRTALGIIDRDGVDGLSMRRLGRVLGRDPMTLYRYADTKTALLDGVVELVLDELTVDSTDNDWQSQLRLVAHRFRTIAVAHPNVVALLVTRPLATPLALRPHGTLRPLEATLALLVTQRVHRRRRPARLPHVLRLPLRACAQRAAGTRRQPRGDRRPAQARASSPTHPGVPDPARLAPALASYDGAAELERGLDILLSGLQVQLIPAGAPPPGR